MKRGNYIFVLILILLLSFVVAELTGEVITGEISAQPTNVSLVMDNNPPTINLDSPENMTYVVLNTTINYSVYDELTGVDTIWYSLDGGQNITLTQNITINFSDYNAHVFVIYANDSLGNIGFTRIDFFVNSSLGWLVNDTKYDGATTDFYELYLAGKPQELNILDVTLERIGHGKIFYTEIINITRHIFDFDEHTHIVSDPSLGVHYVRIDSEEIPEFNKSARITIRNLTFTNPQILRDGEPCGNICQKISYSGGTLVFDVNHFTTYSINETHTEPSEEEGDKVGFEVVSP